MLFAVPAEEYVEIDFRNGLRERVTCVISAASSN